MASIHPQNIELKDGRRALLKTAEPQEAATLLDFIEIVAADGQGLSLSSGEFSLTIEDEKKHLVKMLEHPKKLFLVALDGSMAIGCIDFNIEPRKLQSHSGWFGMSVHPKWRGVGLGDILLREMLAWAKEEASIRKIKLSLLSDNKRALNLYIKHGFIQTGVRRQEFQVRNGQGYIDELLMELWLSGTSE